MDHVFSYKQIGNSTFPLGEDSTLCSDFVFNLFLTLTCLMMSFRHKMALKTLNVDTFLSEMNSSFRCHSFNSLKPLSVSWQ